MSTVIPYNGGARQMTNYTKAEQGRMAAAVYKDGGRVKITNNAVQARRYDPNTGKKIAEYEDRSQHMILEPPADRAWQQHVPSDADSVRPDLLRSADHTGLGLLL